MIFRRPSKATYITGNQITPYHIAIQAPGTRQRRLLLTNVSGLLPY